MAVNDVDRRVQDYWSSELHDEPLAVAMLATIPPAEWRDFYDAATLYLEVLLREYGIELESFLRGEVDQAASVSFAELAELEVIEWKCGLISDEDARRGWR